MNVLSLFSIQIFLWTSTSWIAHLLWLNLFSKEKKLVFVGRLRIFSFLSADKCADFEIFAFFLRTFFYLDFLYNFFKVFVENSCRQPGLGFPFGYIKISTSATVTLYVMPYNYPELLSLLAMGKDPKIGTSHPQFQHKFDKYLRTVPAYYYSVCDF